MQFYITIVRPILKYVLSYGAITEKLIISILETVQEMSRRKAKETMLIKITSQTYFLPREANLTIHGHDTRFLLP